MLRRGVLSVAAYARAQRACAATAKSAVGARAWLSGTAVGNDDPTPAKTKLTFTSSVYGKDPQAAAPLSEEETAEVEALRAKAQGAGAGAAAAPIHDSRNMFESSLSQQAEDGKASGAIKRDVSADTPDETRVAFGATAYGKDPQAAAEVPADVEELRAKASGGGAGAGAGAAPIHDPRNMFDSSLSQQAEDGKASGAIKRDVSADTPDETRVAFGATAYGKDPQAAAEVPAEVEELRAKAPGAGAGAGAAAAPIHSSRSLFDSDLAQGAGSAQGSDSINRDVKADTPEATRLVFGGSDYGKDQRSITRSDEKQAEIEELAARVGAGTAASAAAPIHHDRSMFDSDLAEGAGAAPEFKAINRSVKTATPALTRLSFFGSTYGDEDPGENKAEHAKVLAEEQKKGSKLARVGRGVKGSKVHNTEKAMADDEYSRAGSE